MKNHSPLFLRTIAIVKKIPEGRVISYSGVSNLISAPGCARHVSYILSSSSGKYDLPWHRVLNAKGKISLSVSSGYFEQKRLLELEKIVFKNDTIDFNLFGWEPTKKEVKKILKSLPLHTPLAAR